MTSCPPPLFAARLAAGQTMARALAAGDELFCASGTLQLCSSALAGIDAVAALQWQLRAGQSWRAPAALRLQVTALHSSAEWHCRPAPVAEAEASASAAAAGWRARAGALFRSWRTLGT